jgi:hypothetical protein
MNASDSPQAHAPGERQRLEEAHHDICTALTLLSANVALVRIQVRDLEDTKRIAVHARLDDIELANERLLRLAKALRAWHDEATS